MLANVISTLFVNGKLIFINGPGSLCRNPLNCTILDSWVFEHFVLANELFVN